MRRTPIGSVRDFGLGQRIADLYIHSPGAAAVAAMAEQLGLGSIRLAATTPHLTYVVNAPAGPALDALAAMPA